MSGPLLRGPREYGRNEGSDRNYIAGRPETKGKGGVTRPRQHIVESNVRADEHQLAAQRRRGDQAIEGITMPPGQRSRGQTNVRIEWRDAAALRLVEVRQAIHKTGDFRPFAEPGHLRDLEE